MEPWVFPAAGKPFFAARTNIPGGTALHYLPWMSFSGCHSDVFFCQDCSQCGFAYLYDTIHMFLV